jgi:hypothetical protein
MATPFAVLGSVGASSRSRAYVSETIRAWKQALDDKVLRSRSEAILQAIDEGILRDIGVARGESAETQSEKASDDLISLRTVFSWTRFAK